MKAEDLMVGDIVRVNKNVCIRKGTIVIIRGIFADNIFPEKGFRGSVECIAIDDEDENNCGVWAEHLEPIPITPEILEKNGFINGEFYAESHIEDWQIMSDGSHLAARSERGWCIDIPCRYVHELQHCLKMTGIEKEIIL